MLSTTLGLTLIFVSLLLGRAAKAATYMRPVPWWASDNMCAHLVAPGIVTLMVVGILIFGSTLVEQKLGVLGLESLAGMAVSTAVFVVLWRALAAWSRRAGAAVASATPAATAAAAAQNDPNRPPSAPALKKAA